MAMPLIHIPRNLKNILSFESFWEEGKAHPFRMQLRGDLCKVFTNSSTSGSDSTQQPITTTNQPAYTT